MESASRPLSILLVSPEFPPMPGGIGRYTYNLKKNLIGMGLIVKIVCDRRGDGEFSGISQHNTRNSEILSELVDRIKPDVVHVQYEPGLYGLKLDMLNPAKTFYKYCKGPDNNYFSLCLSIQTMDEPSYSNLRANAGSLPDKKSKTYIQLLDKAN